MPLSEQTIVKITSCVVTGLLLWLMMPYMMLYSIIAADWIFVETIGLWAKPGGSVHRIVWAFLSIVGFFGSLLLLGAVVRRMVRMLAFAWRHKNRAT